MKHPLYMDPAISNDYIRLLHKALFFKSIATTTDRCCFLQAIISILKVILVNLHSMN